MSGDEDSFHIEDGFDLFLKDKGKKSLVFAEGLLWNRHIPEIFEIEKKLGVPVKIYYLANDMRGNDNDIFQRGILKNYRGVNLLRDVRAMYSSEAAIMLPPKISKGVMAEILESWNKQFFLINESAESVGLLTYKGARVGIGILSSYYTYLRDLNFDPREYIDIIRNDFINSSVIYERAKLVIAENQDSFFCLFNGRLKYCRPIVDAVTEQKKVLLYHERGGGIDKYHFSSYSPHDFSETKKTINKIYEKINSIKHNGHDFFARRRGGDGISWTSFTEQQKRMAETPWRVFNSPICAYFSSSDDEFLAIPGFRASEAFSSQLEGVKNLIAAASRVGCSLVIRMHPNQKDVDRKTLEAWLSLRSSNVIVIPPESTISSYQLLDEADCLAVFLSTMGAEGLYAGKRVLFLGNALICGVGNVKSVQTAADIESFLRRHDYDELTKQSNVNAALAYGHYVLNVGTRYAKYTPEGYFNGSVDGKPIGMPPRSHFTNWIVKVRRLLNKSSLISSPRQGFP